MNVENFLVTGIGGQGVILMTKIMARAAFAEGITLNTLETLGSLQRGGPVWVQARIGSADYGASVAHGSADAVIALEGYEGLRVASKFLKSGGLVIQNERLVPVAGHFRTKRKPITLERLPELFHQIDASLMLVPAQVLAEGVGNPQLENLVMFGVLVEMQLFGLKAQTAREVIARSVPTGTDQPNLAAFEAGMKWASSHVAAQAV